MERIIKVISFFLKCQGVNEFSLNERNGKMYVSCADKRDAIRELFDFIRFDYNPCHKYELTPTLQNDFVLIVGMR